MAVAAEPDLGAVAGRAGLSQALPQGGNGARKLEGPSAVLVRTLGSFWRAHTAGWFFIALFGLTSRIAFFDDLEFAIVLTVVLDPLGFGLTALAHRAFRNRVGHGINLNVVLVALVLSVAGGLLQMVVANEIRLAMFDEDPRRAFGGMVVPAVFYTAIFLGWSLAYLWIKADADARAARLQRSEAQEAALRAELHQLRLQLDPHFLFNALNTLAVEIPERPDIALEMTHRIAAYLRYSLDYHGRRLCPLAEEIQAVRAYLRIQELRFEGRLGCDVEIAPSAESVAVPHLILQTLVENAVKHGLQSPAERFTVHIVVQRQGEDLTVEVSNPGRVAPRERDRPAVGLANLRRRLELHYPLGYQLSLTDNENTVVARLQLRGPACFA